MIQVGLEQDRLRGKAVSWALVTLTERLGERGVVVSWRDGNVRAMFHAYNDTSDVDALLAGLMGARELLA